MYGGVEDIRLPAIPGASSSSSHMANMLSRSLGFQQGLSPPGVLTNPTALLSESLKRLDRHETLHLCDILGFHPSILNKLNGHPTELVEAMRDDVELEEEEYEDEQKYQREVMMASLISSWRAFRPEDCEDGPDADDYYDSGGFGNHMSDNSRQGGNSSTDPRLLLLLGGGGDTTHRGGHPNVGKFTARLNAFDESTKSILSLGPLTGRTDTGSEKGDRSPQNLPSGHKTGGTASSRLLLTRSSFRVTALPYQHTLLTCPVNTPNRHTLSTHPFNPPYPPNLSTHPTNPPPYQGGLSGARTASFMLNMPNTSRLDVNHGSTVTSVGGLAPSVPTQGLMPSHATGGGGMNTARQGLPTKNPRNNNDRYRIHQLRALSLPNSATYPINPSSQSTL